MTSVTKTHEALLLDERLKDYTDPQEILGKPGLLKQLTKRGVEQTLEAELPAPLGYAPHARHGGESDNDRHGKGKQTVHLETGELDIEVPPERNGSCEPRLVKKAPAAAGGLSRESADGVCPWVVDARHFRPIRRSGMRCGVAHAEFAYYRACVDGLQGRSEAIEAIFP